MQIKAIFFKLESQEAEQSVSDQLGNLNQSKWQELAGKMTDFERVLEPIVKLFGRIYEEYEDNKSDVRIALILDKTNGVYHVKHSSGVDDT